MDYRVFSNDENRQRHALGPEYTLLRLDRTIDTGPLQRAATDKGVPLMVLDLEGDEASALYDRKLVLCRPDQHIAWRGDALPDDLNALVNLIRGAGNETTVEVTPPSIAVETRLENAVATR